MQIDVNLVDESKCLYQNIVKIASKSQIYSLSFLL